MKKKWRSKISLDCPFKHCLVFSHRVSKMSLRRPQNVRICPALRIWLRFKLFYIAARYRGGHSVLNYRLPREAWHVSHPRGQNSSRCCSILMPWNSGRWLQSRTSNLNPLPEDWASHGWSRCNGICPALVYSTVHTVHFPQKPDIIRCICSQPYQSSFF